MVRERLDRAKAYVNNVKTSSVESVGIDKRGELWNKDEDRVVRQLKTTPLFY